jgi:histidinol-phosphate/aromatic aminotransferase/cobyric acid decarboxylase-like protein
MIFRVGYVVATNEAIEKWNIIRPPFNVTRISEYAAIAALEDQDFLIKMHYQSVLVVLMYQDNLQQ